MRVDNFIYSMNDIKDCYILEYVETATENRNKIVSIWKYLTPIVACFIMFLGITSVLIWHFGKAEIDDPKVAFDYEFNNYDELCDMLPEGHILTNIPNRESAQIVCSASYFDTTADIMDYSKCSYVSIDMSYEDNSGVSIWCEVNPEKTTQEYVRMRPLEFLPDKTKKVMIKDTEVFYTFQDDTTMYIAAFTVENNLYSLSFSPQSYEAEDVIAFIEEFLTK